MSFINDFLGLFLGAIMRVCYNIIKNYGLAIVLFTLFSKIILLPVSVWVHKNSIKMVKMQPEINNLKIRFFGDKDRIAEEQGKLFKQEKYNPLLDIIPLILQLLLLMGTIQIINQPLNYILGLQEPFISSFTTLANSILPLNLEASSVQLSVIEMMQNPIYTDSFYNLPFDSHNLSKAIASILGLKMEFLGLNLGWIPKEVLGKSLLIPLIAAMSAWALSFLQNKINVLQSEQSNLNKYGMMAFSVGLSLFLGMFVPIGVGIYWIASNLFTILQTIILNKLMDPKKHIDYVKLEESKKTLEDMEGLEKKQFFLKKNPNKKRERQDYKRFFSIANKHVVFYSESSGFYKYFKGIIEYLLKNTNLSIHYVTNDPDDIVFGIAKTEQNLKPYYIGQTKTITLMMKMDAKIVIMTTPDIDTYHIKRSYMRDDIEYIYVQHTITSTHMTLSKTALDNFDTIFCVGQHQIDEIRYAEELYHLKKKELVAVGYELLENLIASYSEMDRKANGKKRVLIAPSWQDGNIMDSCLDEIVENLSGIECMIIIRPHPEYVKRYASKMAVIKDKYKDYLKNEIIIEDDFSSNNSVYSSDILITDWSNVAFEFSYATKKPSLYINTPIKVMNEEYTKNPNTPLDITLRNILGKSLEVNEIFKVKETVEYLFENEEEYKEVISDTVNKYVFNLGTSSKVGAEYIIKKLQRKN